MGVALRARTIQAAPLMQVVIFLAVFTSVAYAPRDVLTGWLRDGGRRQPGHLPARGLPRRRAHGRSAGQSSGPALVALSALLIVLGTWAVTGLATLGRR